MSDKNSYEKTAEAKMQQLGAQIDALQAKANLAKADAKVKYQEQIDALRVKQSEAKTKFESLKGSAGNAWEEMKTGVDSAWQELQSAFDKAKSELDK
ncbi:MAG: hypothetical protein WBD47_04425 [Phormidesmis sp.]